MAAVPSFSKLFVEALGGRFTSLRAVPRGVVPDKPEDQRAGFEEQVRALYDSMVRVVVTPTWVRLNDFQRTAPRAVERLVQAKQGGAQR
jgi:hypothetical protein